MGLKHPFRSPDSPRFAPRQAFRGFLCHFQAFQPKFQTQSHRVYDLGRLSDKRPLLARSHFRVL